jgi:hypothetical protein
LRAIRNKREKGKNRQKEKKRRKTERKKKEKETQWRPKHQHLTISIKLFCSGAPKPWLLLRYHWTMLKVKSSIVSSLAVRHNLSKTRCGKNAEAAENSRIYNSRAFFNAVSVC